MKVTNCGMDGTKLTLSWYLMGTSLSTLYMGLEFYIIIKAVFNFFPRV